MQNTQMHTSASASQIKATQANSQKKHGVGFAALTTTKEFEESRHDLDVTQL